MINILPFVLLVVLMACRTQVAFALGLAGVVGIALNDGWSNTSSALGSIPYNVTSTYTLALIPMFVLMGLLASHAGIINSAFTVAERLTRRFHGGLGVATVIACTLAGAVSGSSIANAATIGRISIGEMAKRGYEKDFAAAIVAASGTIALLIPPSIALVVYGIITGESIGALLLAGVIPGIASAVIYMCTIAIMSRKYSAKPGLRVAQEVPILSGREVPSAGGGVSVSPPPMLSYRTDIWMGATFSALMFVLIIGGLYSGVFNATEAGAVGAFASLVLSVIFVSFRRDLHRITVTKMLRAALGETGAMTAMIFALIIGSALFSHFLVVSGITGEFTQWIAGLNVTPHIVLIIFLVALIPVGMVMDGMSMLLIVTPLMYPVALGLGFDGIWFGILLIKTVEIGLVTPPLGINVYAVAGLFPDLSVEGIFRRIAPFILADVVAVATLVVFPELVTFLPRLALSAG